MIQHITFADDRMTISAAKASESALHWGASEGQIYTPKYYQAHYDPGELDINDTFYWLNSEILKNKRGCGFWIWKPWIIADAMRSLKDGEILIYSDAGIEFIAPLKHIIDRMDQDIFFFSNGFPHVEWCKMDAVKAILPNETDYGCNHYNGGYISPEFERRKQVQASVIFFRVNQKTKDLVKEWLLWCQMPGLIDDSPSKIENYRTFAEHRHDQALLTNLQIKYKYKLHWYPTIYAEHLREGHDSDDYPALFSHHRKRNPGMGEGQPEWT